MKEVNDRPVRIIHNKGKHKTETRVFARDIHETFCVQPGCKFKGEHAQQGVCHTTTTFEGGDWKYIDATMKSGEQLLKQTREIAKRMKYTQKQYIEYLESSIVCNWASSVFQLDECIRLRGENALLKKRVKVRK